MLVHTRNSQHWGGRGRGLEFKDKLGSVHGKTNKHTKKHDGMPLNVGREGSGWRCGCGNHNGEGGRPSQYLKMYV